MPLSAKWYSSPNDKAPERIQIWGAFTLVDGCSGTGLVVAFGNLGYIGVFSDELISRPAGVPPYVLMIPGYGDLIQLHSKNPIRQESAAPTAPDSYPLNTGLTRLSNTGDLAAIVNQLQQVLKH